MIDKDGAKQVLRDTFKNMLARNNCTLTKAAAAIGQSQQNVSYKLAHGTTTFAEFLMLASYFGYSVKIEKEDEELKIL